MICAVNALLTDQSGFAACSASSTKDDNIFEAMVSDTEEDELDIKEELAYSRALNKHIEVYVKEVPYMSNSVLGQIEGITSISRLTDIIALFLPTTFERKKEYIEEVTTNHISNGNFRIFL